MERLIDQRKLESERDQNSERETYLLEIVAQQIETAINNAEQAEALRQSEERYRTLFDQSPVGVYIYDREFKIIQCNERMVQILRSSYDRIVGVDMKEIKDQGFMPAMRKALEGEFCHEECFYEATNSLARLWLSLSLSPLRDANGNVIGGMAVVEDITERKRAEEQIREQAALLDKARDAILVRDLEHRIIFWNKGAENLYGWTAKEAIGKKANELLYKKGSFQFVEAYRSVMEKGEWMGELHHVNKKGEEVVVESRWTVVRDSDGNPKSILVIDTNIMERKRLEAQFLRAQRMESVGTLASGIAHDLNNVLSPIMMALQLLRKKLTDRNSEGLLNTLEMSTQRGADLIRQVLSFARGSEGGRTVLQLRYIISEIEKVLRETFPKSIEICTDTPKDLWTVFGDPTQLHQVFMNLCVNARDAISSSGRLNISAENLFIGEDRARTNIDAGVGPYVVVTVSDTGTGIPPEIIDRIFEPFFTTKEPGKGSGLGLSATFGIVKGHGGFMNVHSDVGKGTQFKVYLPAIETNETRKLDEKTPEPPSGQGELILVVDDEASLREVTGVILERYGYRVITAGDGAEAIASYVQNIGEVKAVIIDMVMPLMDGPASVKALHRIDPNVKIIAASGQMEKDKLAEITGIEVQSFLSKPYRAHNLLTTLHEILNGRNGAGGG